jgi:hypothetical protein
MAAIRTSNGTAYAETSFRKVQTVSHGTTDSIVSSPLQKRGVHPTLKNEILYEATNFVIRKGT